MHKRLNTLVQLLVLLSLLAPLTGCVTSRASEKKARAERARALVGTRATYCSAPRKADGRVDVDRLRTPTASASMAPSPIGTT